MADYGLDGSDHGNTKNESKRARMKIELKSDHGRLSSGWVWSWPILVWMGLIINAHLDLGFIDVKISS